MNNLTSGIGVGLFVVALSAACGVSSAIGAEPIRIALLSSPSVTPGETVSIGEIASVSGGDNTNRARVESLDIESSLSLGEHRLIDRRQIEMRLLVDGFARDSFIVDGAEKSRVSCAKSVGLRGSLESLLAKEVTRQFGLDAGQVSVRLLSETQISSAESKLKGRRFDTLVVLEQQLPTGRTQIQVEFSVASGQRFLEQFDTQVIVTLPVALATRTIPPGTKIEPEMLRFISRPVLSKNNYANADEVVGKIATRNINSNEVVLTSYVTGNRGNSNTIIKHNDLIDVLVMVGQNQIRLKNARALNSGAVGDTISVLNTRSDKRLSAIIVDRNLARVTPNVGVIR